ncbi:helix-turn-helix domain-containing protein [Nocardioides carbamazepini]|uniref:PucR family transcriptional regulator n=1 Tax=Nocardioides carbamazepini TaxID=2854259 RepID=UPI002149FFBB|nr:helix-turn-helix domain-containing protein [Nocardioides carbamazepini]MCR1781332.1 helix-turn-helix domain-containing protein [Nocardioides carbamazepini]
MMTAEQIGAALTPSFLTTVVVGEARQVSGLELVEAGTREAVLPGDLTVAVGVRDEADLLVVVDAVRACAGLVARRALAVSPAVAAACRERGLTLLALADDTALSAAVTVLRDVVAQTGRDADGWSSGSVYTDLFALADVLAALLDAPVTIEDARSRVLAYSSGQHGIDDARTSTIIGRQVPREVRDHFRSLGVFRRIAHSDEPVFVPAGGAEVKPRLVIPVRAGGEWLGSVWAVVAAEPAADAVARARTAAEVLALHFLRLRTRGELHRRLESEQVRAVLRGEAATLPGGSDGPWRAVALAGPRSDLEPEERVTVWTALAQRHGWRAPLLCDVDGVVCAVVRDRPAAGPGSWTWLRDLVEAEARADPTLAAAAGGAVDTTERLVVSAAQAVEVAGLRRTAGRPVPAVSTVDEAWPALVLARAVRGAGAAAPVSPIAALVEQDREHDSELVATLCAVIDHWGEPQRAARALGVHPNTVRNRLARLTRAVPVDLEEPVTRLALRLEALHPDLIDPAGPAGPVDRGAG